MTKRVLGPGAKCCGENCGACETETVEAVAVVEADDELDWDDEEDA